MSSKIDCEYCGNSLSIDEIEDHEIMCSSRSTQCKICQQEMIIMDLREHLKAFHGIDKHTYAENIPNIDILNNQLKNRFPPKLSDLDLKDLSSSQQLEYALKLSKKEAEKYNYPAQEEKKETENGSQPDLSKLTEKQQIAYAIAQSAIEAKEAENKNKKIDEYKDNLQNSISIDFDEVSNEMEKYLYEEEMNNYQ